MMSLSIVSIHTSSTNDEYENGYSTTKGWEH